MSMRQTLFPHLMRQNLSRLYYISNSFFGRNDSTDFYDFFDSFCKNSVLNISRCLKHAVLNLLKNKQHFLKFALFFVKDAKNHRNRLIRSYQKTRFKNIPNVHINMFGPPEELDEHTKLSISIFIAFYHTAVESVVLACFSSL